MHALKTAGRLTLGISTTTERFTSNDLGSDKNDTLFSSQRIYYRVSEIGADQWDVVTDLRNKYDSFDKLNKELYQLDPKDEFQVRQLSLQMVNPDGSFSPIIGRFQISEAGSVFVDGVNLQYRPMASLTTGLFAGLNPKQIDKSYLISDSQATQAGAFITYHKKNGSWDTNAYLSHGYVQQKYNNIDERTFLFHNGVYQWEADSRILSLAFFDFIPRSHVQTLYLVYQQKLTTNLSSEVGHLAIDAFEYLRRQNVLEKLEPSSYKEAHIGFEYKVTPESTLNLTYSAGERSSDSLKRTEGVLGYRLLNFISKNWDTRISYTGRKNFTSQDSILAWSLGYFSKSFEVVFDADYALQKNDDGTITHPNNVELNYTQFFSNSVFATLALQRAADESVTIIGTFFKLGYRFGSNELPPIRDGAAPRGSL